MGHLTSRPLSKVPSPPNLGQSPWKVAGLTGGALVPQKQGGAGKLLSDGKTLQTRPLVHVNLPSGPTLLPDGCLAAAVMGIYFLTREPGLLLKGCSESPYFSKSNSTHASLSFLLHLPPPYPTLSVQQALLETPMGAQPVLGPWHTPVNRTGRIPVVTRLTVHLASLH